MDQILLQFGILTAVVLLIGPILGFVAGDFVCGRIECGVWRENGTIVLVYLAACYITYRLLYRRTAKS